MYIKIAIAADRTGQINHVLTIVVSVVASVGEAENRFHPTMPPTMACVVDTGKPALVIA